jgi:hypothetical protein
MSELIDFVNFGNMRNSINNDFVHDLICALEKDLLSDPIGFAFKYGVSITSDEVSKLNDMAQVYLSQTPIHTCPSTSANLSIASVLAPGIKKHPTSRKPKKPIKKK